MQRIVVIGGGAAGMGAAGAAKQVDPGAQIVVFTEYEDVAYSPCGIPYVHGREIESFTPLFLQNREYYQNAGYDIRYETRVTRIDLERHAVTVDGQGSVTFDRLILATGFRYAEPGVPGEDLAGLYYVKNIRQAMEWDKILDTAKVAVVIEGTSPTATSVAGSALGLEMTTAMAHRGLETHIVDPHPWPFADVADPDIMQPVEESWSELGVHMHFNTVLEGFAGDGHIRAVRTSSGELPADIAVVCTPKEPNTELARAAGIKAGSTGGLIVDERMATSAKDVFAAGDCVEIPHGLNRLPLQGLSGSHAYAQGKVAGANAAGGRRAYQPVYIPWGTPAGKWIIGGVAFGEVLAKALGMPYVAGVAEGISRARYYPGHKKIRVKLLAEPRTLRLIGAQMVGGEGIKERADFLAMGVKLGVTLHDLAWMENVYSPAIGALNEPIAMAAQAGLQQAPRAHHEWSTDSAVTQQTLDSRVTAAAALGRDDGTRHSSTSARS